MCVKPLTSSVYTFEDLIKGGFLYVDKTEVLWNLVHPYKAMYFLSRPRRFGKSLTVSTLKAIFEGKKELFKGLAIYDKPYDWKQYPVIHLDNGNCGARTASELCDFFHATLVNIAKENGLKLRGETLSTDFQFLIEDMAKKAPVVVLVDEYDKPILNNISSPASREILSVLKGFYATIKTCESRIRFAFVTGVTKFCHVSLFSDLNNLTDISMNADYATMLGYTQTEFEQNFAEWIALTEEKQDLPHDAFLGKIKNWYDGYRFEESAESVYNPVSTAQFFTSGGKFRNYWFETGTPSFLMELIRQKKFVFGEVLAESVPAAAFETFEIDDIDPVTLLFQTGYLTIKGTEIKYDRTKYFMDFPNREVSESFNTRLLNAFTDRSDREVRSFNDHLSDAITRGDLPKFQKTLEVFFAGIAYDVHHKDEANFQNIFYSIFKLLGFNITAESRTSDGRIDAVVETDRFIYLFEFKLNKDDTALQQIMEKEYFKPYLLKSKRIVLVGANFDTGTGRLFGWKQSEVTR